MIFQFCFFIAPFFLFAECKWCFMGWSMVKWRIKKIRSINGFRREWRKKREYYFIYFFRNQFNGNVMISAAMTTAKKNRTEELSLCLALHAHRHQAHTIIRITFHYRQKNVRFFLLVLSSFAYCAVNRCYVLQILLYAKYLCRDTLTNSQRHEKKSPRVRQSRSVFIYWCALFISLRLIFNIIRFFPFLSFMYIVD